MIILALDTTTRGGSVAVADGGRVLALVPGDATRTHAERLPGEIAAALERAAVTRHQIDLLAVAAGPGGFTGLRIGLAAMQGLAMTLDKPVVGVSALDALAAQVADGEPGYVAPWMDAHRGDVFAALVAWPSGTVVEPPVADSPARLLARWHDRLAGQPVTFIGDAAARDAALVQDAGQGRWRVREPAPLAPEIARLGLRRAEHGEAGPPHALTPLYVRRPEVEVQRDGR
jgi:tRNA threonylcarbamoyladenosine biosynthesis protein TsaB